MDLDELQAWFGDEELELCPRCTHPAALTIEHARSLICFHCGFIRWSGGETSVTEFQRAEAAAPKG